MPQADKPAMIATPTRNRTDGGAGSKQSIAYISGMPNYGDGQDLTNLQGSAPMAATPNVKPMSTADIAQAAQQGQQPAQQGPVDISTLPKLTDPSQRPWEHITTPHPVQQTGDIQGQYQTAYSLFQSMATAPNASPTMKYLAQRIGQAF